MDNYEAAVIASDASATAYVGEARLTDAESSEGTGEEYLRRALELAEAVEIDRKQRALPVRFNDQKSLQELRKAVQRALISKRMDHARPWIWRPTSGGPALTEMGRETGCELRISWYK